ncbi:MAG: hypothetical protein U1F40_07165 [Turneriella sp.]
MDEGSRGMLDSYKSGIDNYVNRLGKDHPKIVPLLALFAEFEALGEECSDFGALHAAASEQNFYGRLTNLMTEAAMAQPGEGKSNEPTVAQASQGYHAAYDSLSAEIKAGPTGKAYERIFAIEKESASALQFMRRLAEEHLLVDISRVQLIAEFKRGQQEIKNTAKHTGGGGISVPATEAYLKATIESMEQAKSITEVEYLAVARAEIAHMATLWDTGFMNSLYHIFGNALTGYMMAATEENRQEVESSARFLGDFFGVDWQALHSVSRVWDFFSVTLWPTVKENYAAKGITTAEGFRDYMKGYFDKAMKDQPPVAVNAANRTAWFWGRVVPLGDVHKTLLNPPDVLSNKS